MAVFQKKDRKGKKCWYIDYYLGGKRKWELVGFEPFVTKAVAEQAERKRRSDIYSGAFIDPKKESKMTFAEFSERYIELHSKKNKSWRDDECRMKDLTAHFESLLLTEVTPDKIEAFISGQRAKKIRSKTGIDRNITLTTINRKLMLLKSMFNRAIDWGDYNLAHPMRRIKLFKENNARDRYLREGEIEALLKVCQEPLRSVVILALNTGLRQSEIRKIKFEDINLELDQLRVPDQKNGKKSYIPLNKGAREVLMQLETKPGLFNYDWRTSWRAAVKAAKITDFKFHDLRHTAGTYMLAACKNLTTVQRILRHSDPRMTQRYAHTMETQMNAAVSNMWTLNGHQNKSTEMKPEKATHSKSLVQNG